MTTDTTTIDLAFGDPEPVRGSQITNYMGVFVDPVHDFYIPPWDLKGLCQLRYSNSQHSSCLSFREDELTGAYVPSSYLSQIDYTAAVVDFLNMGNAYFQQICNRFGRLIRLKTVSGLNMRKLKGNRYGYLDKNYNLIKFKPGEILHVKKYDSIQSIYGVPDWLGGLQSALLGEDAVLFRRKYYVNGSHLGYILLTTDPKVDADTRKDLKAKIEAGKGVGNFKSMYIHAPGGSEKSVQLLPVGDMSRKDEIDKVQAISSANVHQAHRINPVLVGGTPAQGSNLGSGPNALRVYRDSSLRAATRIWTGINEFLPKAAHLKFDINLNTEQAS